jgi:CelD/BcsL family acetyltransferase involved in cellulose biosynthesis/glycosyltransferase involved in cell wall biosynthesis
VLTVVSVGYPFAPCGPDAIGGAEQVLSMLDAALVDAGHRSIVIAPHGSVCRGELRSTPAPRRIDNQAIHGCHESYRAQLRHLLCHEAVDVVHCHGIDFTQYLPDETHVPVLVTLHLWPDVYPAHIFTAGRPNLHLLCVSEAQRRACPGTARPLLIRNGVNLRELTPEQPKDGFVLVLGRICPEKGFHVAIDAAKAAGLRVVIGGAVFPHESHLRYFDEVIAPRIGEDAQFLGPLAGAAKRRLLATARCLAIASTVRETSSLAAMEALACGTAVVALRTPALEELIDDGETGLLVDSPAAMNGAFRDVDQISSTRCRSAAERRCSADHMARKYLDRYAELARDRRATAVSRTASDATVDVITSVDTLEALRHDWATLWCECASTTPFQRPEWLLAWMRHLMIGGLHCAALRRRGRLVALLPLTRSSNGGDPVVELAGSGVSDYLGALVRPDGTSWVADALSDMFASGIGGRDRVDLRQLQPGDPLLRCATRRPGTTSTISCEPDPCPVLDRGAVPRRIAALLRYYQRRAERRGRVSFEIATDRSLPEFIAELYRLHAARWTRRGSPGVLADAATRAFHAEAMPALLGAKLLSVHGMRIDNGLVAIAYCLRTAARVYYYLGGFDPEFAEVSPGTLVLAHAVEAAWRDGAVEFDFLRGREAYKYLWGAVDRRTFRRQLTPGRQDRSDRDRCRGVVTR